MPKDIIAPKAPAQFTLEPGDHGRGDGPLHREPLVKGSPRQGDYGPGTYGNDQFAAEPAADFAQGDTKPEGLTEPPRPPARPSHMPKEKRYGRTNEPGGGGEGKV